MARVTQGRHGKLRTEPIGGAFFACFFFFLDEQISRRRFSYQYLLDRTVTLAMDLRTLDRASLLPLLTIVLVKSPSVLPAVVVSLTITGSSVDMTPSLATSSSTDMIQKGRWN